MFGQKVEKMIDDGSRTPKIPYYRQSELPFCREDRKHEWGLPKVACCRVAAGDASAVPGELPNDDAITQPHRLVAAGSNVRHNRLRLQRQR